MASLKEPKGLRTFRRGGSIFRIRRNTTNKSSADQQHVIVKKLTDTTEKSDTLDDVSEVSWDDDDSTSNGKAMDKLTSIHTESSSAEGTLSEVDFWEKVSQDRLQNDHPETAESFSNLGIAQMNGNDADAACQSFTTAAVKFGKSHLGAAKNYNLLGRAACQAKRLDLAMESLEISFTLRLQVLGPLHVDTVDTFNNIAGVYYKQHNNLEAARCYREVLTLRQAIFGLNHPSVAVTARDLARTCIRLDLKEEAQELYSLAMSTCQLTTTMTQMKADLETEMTKRGIQERLRIEL
jgi:tetratricopeptide (TPR) repeat protein